MHRISLALIAAAATTATAGFPAWTTTSRSVTTDIFNLGNTFGSQEQLATTGDWIESTSFAWQNNSNFFLYSEQVSSIDETSFQVDSYASSRWVSGDLSEISYATASSAADARFTLSERTTIRVELSLETSGLDAGSAFMYLADSPISYVMNIVLDESGSFSGEYTLDAGIYRFVTGTYAETAADPARRWASSSASLTVVPAPATLALLLAAAPRRRRR